MSDTTDDMDAAWGVYESQCERWQEIMEARQWQTRVGAVLKISEMKTSHIQNCIRMLERHLASRPNEYAYGEPEGDAAQDAFNSEIAHNDYIEDLLTNKIKQFKEELESRGVNATKPTDSMYLV